MAELRFLRGWTEAELEDRIDRAERLERNFSVDYSEMTLKRGWNHYFSESVIATEAPGEPEEEGAFQRAWNGIQSYEFSDPSIVTGHFDPNVPLLNRPMLLELKVLGLHYLCAVVVGAVRSESTERETVFGFRYDTLQGHIERGAEWFLLTKDHTTGDICFRVDANWRPGDFPNWWSRFGFTFLAPRYQETWHRRAHKRLSLYARYGDVRPPQPTEGRLVHAGPDVEFKLRRGHRT